MDGSKERPQVTAGLDLGDKYSYLCLIDTQSGEVMEEALKRRAEPVAQPATLPKGGQSVVRCSERGEGGEKMRKRIALLITALMLALTTSFGAAGGAFAAKTTTFSKGTCVTKAGQGGGGGEIKDRHHGSCNSNGSSF
jgi:hypothetical protein